MASDSDVFLHFRFANKKTLLGARPLIQKFCEKIGSSQPDCSSAVLDQVGLAIKKMAVPSYPWERSHRKVPKSEILSFRKNNTLVRRLCETTNDNTFSIDVSRQCSRAAMATSELEWELHRLKELPGCIAFTRAPIWHWTWQQRLLLEGYQLASLMCDELDEAGASCVELIVCNCRTISSETINATGQIKLIECELCESDNTAWPGSSSQLLALPNDANSPCSKIDMIQTCEDPDTASISRHQKGDEKEVVSSQPKMTHAKSSRTKILPNPYLKPLKAGFLQMKIQNQDARCLSNLSPPDEEGETARIEHVGEAKNNLSSMPLSLDDEAHLMAPTTVSQIDSDGIDVAMLSQLTPELRSEARLAIAIQDRNGARAGSRCAKVTPDSKLYRWLSSSGGAASSFYAKEEDENDFSANKRLRRQNLRVAPSKKRPKTIDTFFRN